LRPRCRIGAKRLSHGRAVALRRAVSIVAPTLADSAALLAAALDLKLVTLLTDAMRAVDANAQKDGQQITPADRYEPSRVIHPEPRYAPQQVIYRAPELRPNPEVQETHKPCDDLCPPTAPCAPEPPTCSPKQPSPIQPPWAVLPWPAQESPRVVKMVKVLQLQPDNTCRGTILDRFL
jgi:hypothetical protein